MKIEVLFPEICNLFGELGNIRYLKDCLNTSGEDFEIIETEIHDQPLFVSEKPDLIYMGAMTENSQEIVINILLPWKDKIIDRIQDDTRFLITGNALEIFGQAIKNEDGSEIKGLNLFNTIAKRKMFDRFNSLYWGKYGDDKNELDIFGFKSQFTHTWIDETQTSPLAFSSLFQTVKGKGPGLNPGMSGEGIRCHHFMATYLIGPLLIINPLFTKILLSDMGVSNPQLAYHEEIMEAYQVRKEEFTAPGKGFTY